MIRAPKESWVLEAKKTHLSLFSELDLLLRALDRFFNLEDMPSLDGQFTTKNFLTEMNAGRETIARVLSILERLIPQDKKNAYLFQKFAENKLLHGSKRSNYRQGMYRQDTPEKSLYVLYGTFLNLKSIVTDLKRIKYIEFMSFKNLGQLVSKEIRENIYFNPFRGDMDPDLDQIKHSDITDIVRGLKVPEVKKAVSVTFLYLFRFLRYLDHVRFDKVRLSILLPSLLIINLLNSETELFRIFMKRTVQKLKDKSLAKTLESLSYQFTMETKRVYKLEMKDIFEYKTATQLRGIIENSNGILRNLIEHTIINLAQHWKENVRGEDIFDDFITKTEQAVRLRENVYLLSRMLVLFEKSIANPAEMPGMLKCLKRFMEYFEKTTFMLLRHDDYSEFQSFFVETLTYELNKKDFRRFVGKCHYFIVFLDATLNHINNRAELIGQIMDYEKAEDVLKELISSLK